MRVKVNVSRQFTKEGRTRLPSGVEFAASFFAEVPAGELLEGVAVSLEVAMDEHGQPHCTGLHLNADESAEVTWRELRQLPLERLLKTAWAAAISAGMTIEKIPGGYKGRPLTDHEADEAVRAAWEESRRRGPRALDDEFLGKVAATYQEALEHDDAKVRRGPTRYVALRLGGGTDGRGDPTSYHAAKTWVGKARVAGLLPTTSRGRKAG